MDAASYLDGLNERQLEAVTHSGGHCLVLAGAGSGKTRVLTHRIAWLIERGVDPSSICAVTFTNKAAAEMQQRVRGLLGGQREGRRQLEGLWLSTFHSLGLRLLREWSDTGAGSGAPPGFAARGLPRLGFAVYDRDASLSVWRQCQSALRISSRDYDPARLFNACSRAVNRLEDPASWDAPNRSWDKKIAARVWQHYRRAMDAAGAVDFDDLLHRPLQVLTHDAELRRHTAGRFSHLLIDEYQDTNRLQYRLVQALLGDDSKLLVVGDEDQAIYRWRGADLNNVLDFQNDFDDATVIRLEQNYRSTQPILSAAGSLVAHNRQRLGKSLWTDLEGGERPIFVQCATDREEAQWVAKKVRQIVELGSAAKQETASDTSLEPPADAVGGGETFLMSDVAVLYRTNAQSRLFEEIFIAERIPHRVVGGPRFFARREVRDVLAYLQLLVRPDDVAFRRAIGTPSRGVGPKTLEALDAMEGSLSVSATVETLAAGSNPEAAFRKAGCAPGAVAGLLTFARLLGELRELAGSRSLPQLIRTTIARSGYGRALEAEPDAEDRLANLDELVAAARETAEVIAGVDNERSPTGNGDEKSRPGDGDDRSRTDAPGRDTLAQLRAFLDRLALLTEGDSSKGSADGVRLLTVHAAKGLEFGAVFLAGMEEELFPHATSIADGQIEEERRLCYVGMTRAERRLFLSAARSRRLHGRDRWQEPSRFIAEIDPRHLIVNDYVSPNAVGSKGYAPSAFTGLGGRTGQRRRGRAGYRGSRSGAGGRGSTGRGGKGKAATPVKLSAGQPTRPAAEGDLVEGATVLHPMFGPGRITDATGTGEKLKLTIRFNKAGTKSVIASYAKLEVPD